MTTHVCSIYPEGVGIFRVRCDRGCYLGTSAVQGTREGAETRAELHEQANNYYNFTEEKRAAE